jgi:hypothetical protein
MRRRKSQVNLALKLAILDHSATQRRFAQQKNWSEIRLSEIINNRHNPVTDTEKRRLARQLNQPIEALFPTADADTAPATATGTEGAAR